MNVMQIYTELQSQFRRDAYKLKKSFPRIDVDDLEQEGAALLLAIVQRYDLPIEPLKALVMTAYRRLIVRICKRDFPRNEWHVEELPEVPDVSSMARCYAFHYMRELDALLGGFDKRVLAELIEGETSARIAAQRVAGKRRQPSVRARDLALAIGAPEYDVRKSLRRIKQAVGKAN